MGNSTWEIRTSSCRQHRAKEVPIIMIYTSGLERIQV
ncbi:hypothetical protein A2U01_0038480, partial [Trifolium medium]|nr:hypothetical protein [Trifolium medium]